jgi:hypothetical protein
MEAWYAALERRHLGTLTFQEVRRALQALSTIYVGRRDKLTRGDALDGAGKRAAFALFYAPLHYLTVRQVVRALSAATPPPGRIVDLGCGTGTAGTAWAMESGGRAPIAGIDTNGWAIGEAAWNARTLGLRATYRRGDLLAARLGAAREAIVAAYVVNELTDAERATLLEGLVGAAAAGSRVLVIEPVAKAPVASWWRHWEKAFAAAGGRSDLWRFPAVLPDRMKLLDKAAGLDHRELTARSLSVI